MRVVGRILGWFLLLIAVGLLGRDLIAWASAGSFALTSLGELWYHIDRASLNGLQAGIERYLTPDLWWLVVEPLLFVPALIFFLVPGLALAYLCRKPGEDRKRPRHSLRRR